MRLLPPPFNHPARSAEMAAVLDIMSKGRYDFGVGRSITEAELGGFRIEPEDSRPMLEEVLPEIVKMWTENPYPGFEGKYFSMPERPVVPKPVQDPHPPIWMACTQPSSFDLAADLGIGVLAFGVGAPGDVVHSLKRYKERIANPARQVGKFVNNAVAPGDAHVLRRGPRRGARHGSGRRPLVRSADRQALRTVGGTGESRVTSTTDSSPTIPSS